MEFPVEGRASAKKFLEYFLSKNSFPASLEDAVPVQPPSTNGRGVRETEVEAECMNMCRNLLAGWWEKRERESEREKEEGKKLNKPPPPRPKSATMRCSIRKSIPYLLSLGSDIRECTYNLLTFFCSSCPGLLNYNITCAAIQELMGGSLEEYRLKKESPDEEQESESKFLFVSF